MRRAMELAELGRGWTKTNPVVGAVLVKEDRIIGEGYHKKFGGLHAEREALADCRSRGAMCLLGRKTSIRLWREPGSGS